MKHQYILSAFLFITFSSRAQQPKNIEIPVDGNDTSYWYRETCSLLPALKLQNLQTATDSFHFRLWTSNQVVSVRINNNQPVTATVTSFAERYNEALLKKGKREVDKVFFKTKKLDTAIAAKIAQAISSLQIESIPSDHKIEGWRQGLDGEEYMIETATRTSYAFRTYWTPRVFADSLPEAKRIQTLIHYVINDLELGLYRYNLKLPQGTYKTNSGVPGINIRTQTTGGAKTIYDLL